MANISTQSTQKDAEPGPSVAQLSICRFRNAVEGEKILFCAKVGLRDCGEERGSFQRSAGQ